MKNLEKASRLLGDKFSNKYPNLGQQCIGMGFSIWCDFKKTIYVDFFGYDASAKMDELSNAVLELHKELEIDSLINVTLYESQQKAEDKMLEIMNIKRSHTDSSTADESKQ